MSRAVMAAVAVVLAAGALGGCASSSRIGPYVKHVARNGDWLVVHKCVIVLDGHYLTEADCTVEQLPLRSIPQGPPPGSVAPPPSGPPPGTQTMPPPAR